MAKTILFPKPIPTTETERVEEAKELLKKLSHSDMIFLTTREKELVDELGDGLACTRLRLKELRDAVESVEEQRKQAGTK